MNVKTTSNELTGMTETDIRELVKTWYEKLDNHAPFVELVPMLEANGLKMVFPETTAEGLAGLQQWYDRVIHVFFDEVHTLKQVTITPKGDRAEVKVIVTWEASRWFPPAPISERIMADAYQTWEVVRSTATDKPAILTYIVDALEYHPGSVKL